MAWSTSSSSEPGLGGVGVTHLHYRVRASATGGP
jgi:hypothetical protein